MANPWKDCDPDLCDIIPEAFFILEILLDSHIPLDILLDSHFPQSITLGRRFPRGGGIRITWIWMWGERAGRDGG